MEREGPRTLSIEPYIEQGGILGETLTVSDRAASSVMRRTALRRDVVVTKGYGRERLQTVGSDELALLRSRTLPFGQRQLDDSSKVSDLTHDQSTWVIRVHDQQLHDVVDEWMKKKFRTDSGVSGQEVYKRRFLKDFNVEVSGGVSNAFWQEKRERFVVTLVAAGVNDLLIASSIASFYFGVRIALEGFLSMGKEPNYFVGLVYFLKGVGGSLLLCLGVSIGLAEIDHFKSVDELLKKRGMVRSWERFIPNPQIPSIVAGSASLLVNSRKLIVFKDEK